MIHMRIAFVTDVIYPYINGGAEKRIHEFSLRLRDAGNEVHIYGIKWWQGPAVQVIDGITYHGVARPMGLYEEGGRRSIAEALVFAAALIIPLLRERFDIIDCNEHPYFSMFSCKLASLLRGGKFYVTWHEVWGDYWYEYMGRVGFFGKFVEKVTSYLPDRIIAVSGRTAADLEHLGVKKDRIMIVPNGYSHQSIEGVRPKGGPYDVVFAGRLIKDKHVDMLIRACASASVTMPLNVLIIGDGPEIETLKTLAGGIRVKGHIEFAGRVSEDFLLSSVKASRVFILPSTREGFSIITLEALACGVPVITVSGERNAAKELVKSGFNGFVVSPNEKELCDAILKMLGDEGERKRMSEYCASSIAGYDWDVLNGMLLECYVKH